MLLLPPHKLRRDGLLPTLLNVSATRIAAMQRYIREVRRATLARDSLSYPASETVDGALDAVMSQVARPASLFDYRGTRPDAFSAFLDELIHLSKTRLPRLDRQRDPDRPAKRNPQAAARRASNRPPMCEAVPSWLPGRQKAGVLNDLCRTP